MRPAPARLSLAAAIAIAASVCAPAALAGEAAAADFFRAGRAAYARKDYRAAATAFEAAFRETPHAAAKYNAALSWELAHEPARAADAFEAALAGAEGLNAEQVKDARARLDKLEDDLGRLDVAAPPGTTVSVAHLEHAETPLKAHLPPGEHEVLASTANGSERRRRVRIKAGEVASIRFAALATPSEPGAQDDAPGPGAPPASKEQSDVLGRADSGGSPLRTAGWITLAFGAAAGVAIVALGVAANDAEDDWNQHNAQATADGRDPDTKLLDNAEALETWTNVAVVTAATLGVAGVVMLVIAPDSRPRTTVRLTPTGAWLTGRF